MNNNIREVLWQERKQNVLHLAEIYSQKRPDLKDEFLKEAQQFASQPTPTSDHDLSIRGSKANYLSSRWLLKARS